MNSIFEERYNTISRCNGRYLVQANRIKAQPFPQEKAVIESKEHKIDGATL